MFQMDIETPKIYKCSIASWLAPRLGLGREVASNPSDCKKYNENMKFLRNLFFLILFSIKYYLHFYNGYLKI